jgi:hypothetical protein
MSVLYGGEASTSRLSRFIPREKTLCTQNGEIVGLYRGLDALEKGTTTFIWSELNHYHQWPALKPNHYADNAVHVP